VTLLEAGAIGEGCSWGNAGLIVPSHSVPLAAPGVWQKGLRWLLRRDSPFRIRPRLDWGLVRWLWAFRRACTEAHVRRALPLLRELHMRSRQLFEELAGQFEFGYRARGMLMALRTAPGLAAARDEARLLEDHGIQARVLDREATLAAEPSLRPIVTGSVCFPEDAQVVPDAFVKGLVARSGAAVRTATPARALETSGRRITAVQTSKGTLVADEVVLAAGAHSRLLAGPLGLHLPLEGGKGYSVTLDTPPSRPRVPLMLGEARLILSPMGDRLRLSGTLELSGLDASVDRRRATSLLGAAAQWLKDPPAANGASIWSGLRPCTPDGLPLLGRTKRFENLIVATGHAMLGVSLGPVTGLLVSEIAAQQPPSIPTAALDPERFS
jgi:D-amino-acid dehydrogenase